MLSEYPSSEINFFILQLQKFEPDTLRPSTDVIVRLIDKRRGFPFLMSTSGVASPSARLKYQTSSVGQSFWKKAKLQRDL